MDDFKSWLTSKTVWASVLGVLLQVAVIAKVPLPGDLDVQLVAGHLANLFSAVLFLAAGLFRLTAKHKLTV